MKTISITLTLLLLLTPSIMLSSAQTPLSIEWHKNNGFDLNSGINGQYTLIARPAGNNTTHIEFYIDEKLQHNDTQAPYSWTFNTDSYPEGQHTVQVKAYTSTEETSTATDMRNFTGFPYISIVGVLLFAGIVFAFTLLLTWYLIKQKAKAKQTAGKTSSITNH